MEGVRSKKKVSPIGDGRRERTREKSKMLTNIAVNDADLPQVFQVFYTKDEIALYFFLAKERWFWNVYHFMIRPFFNLFFVSSVETKCSQEERVQRAGIKKQGLIKCILMKKVCYEWGVMYGTVTESPLFVL